MNIVIRISLAILLATELVVGFWNRVIPANFYINFPTVDATLPNRRPTRSGSRRRTHSAHCSV